MCVAFEIEGNLEFSAAQGLQSRHMQCENCGRALMPGSDPLCGACLGELRAGAYSHSEDGRPPTGPASDLGRFVRRSDSDEDPAA